MFLGVYKGGNLKNMDSPKWMVKKMENPIEMDDLVVPPIFGNIHIQYTIRFPINLARSKQPMTMWDNDPTVRDVLNLELCLPSCVSCF